MKPGIAESKTEGVEPSHAPEVSVIVPVYRVEEYLDACVHSILDQTFSDFELILVDDGSPDSCGAMCDRWAKQDSRIRVVHRQNGGLSAARNTGLDACRGSFVSFIDSDDTVSPDFLEYLLQLIHMESNISMSVCGMRLASRKSKSVLLPPRVMKPGLAFATLMYQSELLGVYACNKLYRRELFDSVRYPVGELYEDSGVIGSLIDKSTSVAIGCDEKYYYNDDREGNIVGIYSEKGCLEKREHLERINQAVRDRYPEALEAFDVYSMRSYCGMMKQLTASALSEDEKRSHARVIRAWMDAHLRRSLGYSYVKASEKTNWMARRFLPPKAYSFLKALYKR